MSKTDDITINAVIVNGKRIPADEFDYGKHVLEPYREKHGTLRGQPLMELLITKFDEFVKERMGGHAEGFGNHG